MQQDIKAGLAIIVLGALILLGLLAFAVQVQSYAWLAVLVFGFVATGLIGMGLYLIMQRTRQPECSTNCFDFYQLSDLRKRELNGGKVIEIEWSLP